MGVARAGKQGLLHLAEEGAVQLFRPVRNNDYILGAVGLVQTVPSLALLVFMIPLFGIGYVPALVALLLSALIPPSPSC